MNKVERIKVEIESLKNELIQEAEKGYKSEFDEGRISAFEDMIIYINSLEEDPVSEDLEKEIQRYYNEMDGDCRYMQTARHFARWQKRQVMKNSDFINEAEWKDDIHKLFREKGKKVKLMIVEEE
jgi:hypothetical protein